jgi:hypothetical protein
VRGGTGRRWDVLAWNRAAAAVFGDYAKIPERERNIVRLVFTAPEYRQLMVDWESDARRVLALFRADYGRHTGDHDFEDLTNELRAKSAEFRVWWAAHDIAVRKEGRKEFHHHEVGRLRFEHTAFYVADDLHLKLVIYTPLGETANKVTRLLSSMPPNAISPQ